MMFQSEPFSDLRKEEVFDRIKTGFEVSPKFAVMLLTERDQTVTFILGALAGDRDGVISRDVLMAAAADEECLLAAETIARDVLMVLNVEYRADPPGPTPGDGGPKW